MTLFDERIIPRLEEIRQHFEIPYYPYVGVNSNDHFGIDVVEDNQVKTICTITDNYACIVCCKRGLAMSLSFVMDKDLVAIDYNLQTDDITEISNISTSPSQEGIQLDSEKIQYLKDFYQYLQTKLVQYENSSN
ncbi:hypothetical protein DQT32_03705 [Salmonella enterica subsp. enterica serovar Braenderup]|nr:hypothetical protein [Salmonella enterica subsp. enterica serovar Braenderup]